MSSDDTLPRFLSRSILDLLAEHRREHEQRSAIPPWWVAHVQRYKLHEGRLLRPEPTSFVLILVYWSVLILSLVVQRGLTMTPVLFTAIVLAFGVSSVAYLHKITLVNDAAFARRFVLLHYLLLPTSLFLFGREFLAWRRWEERQDEWHPNARWRDADAITALTKEYREAISALESATVEERETLEASSTEYIRFVCEFRELYRNESPYTVHKRGEVLRLDLAKQYLTITTLRT